MSRYKNRTSAKSIERAYPHIVEIVVPPNGFGRRLDMMHNWHMARGIQSRSGRRRYEEPNEFIRWCFADAETADAFAAKFGGTRHS